MVLGDAVVIFAALWLGFWVRFYSGFIPLAAILGDVLFTGAVAGTDVTTGAEPDDPALQAKFAVRNLATVLNLGGFSASDIRQAFIWEREFA